MRALLVAVLVSLSLNVFAQAVVLPVEIPVSDVGYAPLGGNDSVKVVSNGHGFLAVWLDRRDAGSNALYAARIAADGTVLDPLGVKLGSDNAVSMVWTGRRYLMDVLRSTGTLRRYILSFDENLVLRDQFEINVDLGGSVFATNGTDVLMVTRSGTVMQLDLDGRTTGSFRLDPFVDSFDVASNSEGYVIAWVRDDTVYAQTIGGERVTLATGVTGAVSIESDGSSYLVVYGGGELRAQVINGNAAPLFPMQTLQVANTPGADITWRNGEYVLTYFVGQQWFDIRANPRGELARGPVRLTYARGTAGASLGDRVVFVWLAPDSSVHTSVVRSEQAFENTTALSVAAKRQEPPQLASIGGSVFTLWLENHKELRIAQLGGESQVVSESGAFFVELVSDGNFLWAIWATANKVHVCRYTPALLPVDAAPLEFDAPDIGGEYSATAGGDGVVVAWGKGALVLRANGASVDAARIDFAALRDVRDSRFVVAAWNGSEYVAGWIRHTEGFTWAVLAVRISREGVLIDPVPLTAAENTFTRELWSLRAATAIGGGVVFGWRDDSGTYATIFRGEERKPETKLRDTPPLDLEQIVVSGNRYLFFWTLPRAQRVSAELETEGEWQEIHGIGTAFDVATVGDRVFLGYSREVEELGGVTRGFVRHNMIGTKRRPVR